MTTCLDKMRYYSVLLGHASGCNDDQCVLEHCKYMKLVIAHARTCDSAPLVSFQVRVRERSNVVVWCSVVGAVVFVNEYRFVLWVGGAVSRLATETLYHQKARFGFSGDTYSILSHL